MEIMDKCFDCEELMEGRDEYVCLKSKKLVVDISQCPLELLEYIERPPKNIKNICAYLSVYAFKLDMVDEKLTK